MHEFHRAVGICELTDQITAACAADTGGKMISRDILDGEIGGRHRIADCDNAIGTSAAAANVYAAAATARTSSRLGSIARDFAAIRTITIGRR